MQITKHDLAKAFKSWYDEFKQSPENFDNNVESEGAAERSAEYLWSILEEMKGNE